VRDWTYHLNPNPMHGEMFTDAKAASYTSAEAMTRSDLMHRSS